MSKGEACERRGEARAGPFLKQKSKLFSFSLFFNSSLWTTFPSSATLILTGHTLPEPFQLLFIYLLMYTSSCLEHLKYTLRFQFSDACSFYFIFWIKTSSHQFFNLWLNLFFIISIIYLFCFGFYFLILLWLLFEISGYLIIFILFNFF